MREVEPTAKNRRTKLPPDQEARRLRRQVLWLLLFISAVAYVAWLWPLGYAAMAVDAVRRLVQRG